MLSGAFLPLVSSFSRVKGIFFNSNRIGLGADAACTRKIAAPANGKMSAAGRTNRNKDMFLQTIPCAGGVRQRPVITKLAETPDTLPSSCMPAPQIKKQIKKKKRSLPPFWLVVR